MKFVKKVGKGIKSRTYNAASTAFRTRQGKNAHSISTPNTLKTTLGSKLTPNFLRGKTSRQAQEALKGIYGSSNALKVQRIDAKQKAYTSAVNSQKGKVEEAQKKMNTNLNSISVFGSAPKSRTRKILTLGLGSVSNAIKKKIIQSRYTKQQKILKALEGKQANYTQKAKKATTKITAKTGISATTSNGETKTLSQVIEESKKAYNQKRIEPLIANRSKFEAAVSIKKGIDNAVVAAQRTLELAIRKVRTAINPAERQIAEAELATAKGTLATANKALTTNSYKVASNTSKTLGKKLIKTQKLNLLTANELTKISRGNNNAAKIRAKATAFRSGIQEQRSLSKYGSFNKLSKYSDPDLQKKLLSRIDKGAAAMKKQTKSIPLSRQEVKDLKYAVKAQSILTLFNEKGLLTNKTIKSQFNGKAKLNITKSSELTTEEKTKGAAELQVNIATKAFENSQAAKIKANQAAQKAKNDSSKLESQGAVKNFLTLPRTKPKAKQAVIYTQALANEAQKNFKRANNEKYAATSASSQASKALLAKAQQSTEVRSSLGSKTPRQLTFRKEQQSPAPVPQSVPVGTSQAAPVLVPRAPAAAAPRRIVTRTSQAAPETAAAPAVLRNIKPATSPLLLPRVAAPVVSTAPAAAQVQVQAAVPRVVSTVPQAAPPPNTAPFGQSRLRKTQTGNTLLRE